MYVFDDIDFGSKATEYVVFGLPNYDHDGIVEVVYGKFNW